MKSYKEFIYLTRHAGLFYSTYYLLHKVILKVNNSKTIKSYKKIRSEWLSKIFNHLFVFENKVLNIDGKELCKLTGTDKTFNEIYIRPLTSDTDVYSQVLKNKDYAPVAEIYNQLFT